MQISEQLHLGAPPEQVWPLLTTGDGLRQWVDGFERLEPDPLAEGSCRVVVLAAGASREQQVDILGCQAPARLSFSLTGGNLPIGASLVVEVALEPVGEGTRARIDVDAQVGGFLAGLALPAIVPVARTRLREAAQRLEQALARGRL